MMSARAPLRIGARRAPKIIGARQAPKIMGARAPIFSREHFMNLFFHVHFAIALCLFAFEQ